MSALPSILMFAAVIAFGVPALVQGARLMPSLRSILAKREAIAAAKHARVLQRATRPLPQYPNAHQSLKVHMSEDHFTKYQPRGASALPLAAGEVYELRSPRVGMILNLMSAVAVLGFVLAIVFLWGH